MDINFDAIVLTDDDLALLARLSTGEEIAFYSSGPISASFNRLFHFGFVTLDRAKKQRMKDVTDWVRYAVTTAIALAALLLSLLK